MAGNGSIVSRSISGTQDAFTHANQRDRLIGSSIVLMILPTIFVSLRIASRKVASAGLWWDDYLILVALVLTYGPCIIILISTTGNGFGRHIDTLPLEARRTWFVSLWAYNLFYYPATCAVKFAILAFYRRIFPIAQLRLLLLTASIIVVGFLFACFFSVVVACRPVHAFWDHGTTGAHCINIDAFLLASGSINVIFDFLIVSFPIPLLWRLRTTRSQKLTLTGIFACATFVCIVSIIRLVVLSRVTHKDVTWNFVNAAIWTACEPSMGVISACLPSLRPLWTLEWKRTIKGPGAKSGAQTTSDSSRAIRSISSINNAYELGSFQRLEEQMVQNDRWGQRVMVEGGGHVSSDGISGSQEEIVLPECGIHVKTEVTLISSDRLDYHDHLY